MTAPTPPIRLTPNAEALPGTDLIRVSLASRQIAQRDRDAARPKRGHAEHEAGFHSSAR